MLKIIVTFLVLSLTYLSTYGFVIAKSKIVNWRINQNSVCNRILKLYQNNNDESIPSTEHDLPSMDDEIDQRELEKILDLINNNETIANTNTTKPIELSPLELAIKAKEADLKEELSKLENSLRSERLLLSKIKDKVSESGKIGFFMIQAQVTDFQRKKDIEQKNLVKKSKRDFVNKLLPIIDSFRSARTEAPPTTEREENMHKNFGSLLSSILLVLEKSGFKEYSAEIGSKIDPHLHKIASVRESDSDGVILEEVKPGIIYNNEDIIRPAYVVSSKLVKPEKTETIEEPPKVEENDVIINQ